MQDILQNDRINLDENFKFSFVKEIIKVSAIFDRCIFKIIYIGVWLYKYNI